MGATSENPHQTGFLTAWVPVVLAAAIFAFFAGMIGDVSAGLAPEWSWAWLPGLDVALAFRVDGLALTFCLLISGIGTLIMLYASSYLNGHPEYGRFALYLFSFMLAMLGVVLADDIIALFVFWELTTITSYLLIGFNNAEAKARRNALQALFLTGAGALALLAGLILLASIAGSTRISEIVQVEGLTEHRWFTGTLILILLGAFTKSAQIPFHFWLPNAMAAPTPVSAFLHSATMVKAGVYLLARFHPAFADTSLWIWSLTLAGAATAVWASILALRQTDLKQALAYTTLMALGTLTLFLGQSDAYAMTGFITFLIVHSLYKAALFMVVGAIDHETGTREVAQLGGLGRLMPVTALAAALAALSMAGLPPLLGFIGKELLYAGALDAISAPVLVTAAALAANALMVAVAGIVALRPFWRGGVEALPKTPHEAPWQMLAGPVILAALGLIFGLAPSLLQDTLVAPTVAGLLGTPDMAKTLTLWHGVNLPLLLSGATLALGAAIYALHGSVRAFLITTLSRLPAFDNGWDVLINGLKRFAAALTAIIQTGDLRDYMRWTFLTLLVALVATGLLRNAFLWHFDLSDMSFAVAAILIITALAAVTATRATSRLMVVIAIGVVGVGVALIFITFGAPDVAITQLLVETLSVILVATVMLKLPRLYEGGTNPFRAGHALIAVALGGTMTLIMMGVVQGPLDLRLTEFFEQSAWVDAYGRNIVNVILVDFRALDTFGEIAVVAIAGIAAYALLRATSYHKKGEEK
ncbi:proton-conducting transporter membrane subunit [Rhodobacteraceae bacterium XHP0102]|nr:proton-conducting transporter membrane subunit [Rhodobacteraceae bacterium XHP0102]